MEFHSVASIFPLMGQTELNALSADIATNGQREPIWTHDGKIIDGRNRYLACVAAGIDPHCREWSGQGSLVAYVLSLNLHRRHLSSSQKAVVALDLERYLAVEAKARMAAGGGDKRSQAAQSGLQKIETPIQPPLHAAQQAADLVGTNRQYVSDAKTLATTAPELLEQVRSGEITIPQAKKRQKDEKRDEVREQKDTSARQQETRPSASLSCWSEWLSAQEPADLLFTDPPYSTDVDNVWTFAHTWLPAALDKVKRTGRAYVCIGAYPDELAAYLAAPHQHMTLANVLVWTYRNTLGPSPKHDYKLNWQAILYFRGPDAPPLDCPIMTEQFTVQDINAPDGRLGDRYHTWQKPDELAERLIRHSTQPGATVIDPFCGTGTFLLAAARLGRCATGCDLSAEMLAIAEQRGVQCRQM